ncbi:MAG: hypothetical protein WD971_03170 [Pirellulales bacterium]
MEIRRWLVVLLAAMVLAGRLAVPARAVKIDDFESFSSGTISAAGNNATGGVWSTLGTNNAVIQGVMGNRELAYGAATNSHAWRPLPAGTQIADTDTATLFVRFRANLVNPNSSFGLSATNPVTNADDFGVYTAQFRMIADTPTTFQIEARNGAIFQDLALGLTPGAWYNLWMVVNQTTDTWEAYLNSGSANATSLNQVGTGIAFRNPTSNPLVSLLAYGGAGPNLSGSIDDVWLTPGADLTNHASLPPVAGDTDGDGVVEPTDFNPIRSNFFNVVPARTQGDLNVDNTVNFADFREWKNAINAGSGAAHLGGGGSVPVPELASEVGVWFALAGMLLGPCWGRRNGC